MDFKFDIIVEYLPYFGKGVLLTLGITFFSILIGTVLGLALALLKLFNMKIVNIIYVIYVTIFRGTPVLVQLFIIHFAFLPLILSEGNVVISTIVTLSLNSAAYIAEIFRGAIESIDHGQGEAARSLGFSMPQSLRYIILPQATKRAIPALGNEFIVLLKESSLGAVITTNELLYYGRAAAVEYNRVWEPYLTVALIYLFLTVTLTFILGRVERRLDIK